MSAKGKSSFEKWVLKKPRKLGAEKTEREGVELLASHQEDSKKEKLETGTGNPKSWSGKN